jgi:LysR family glycine cleavage system transcriptional activator
MPSIQTLRAFEAAARHGSYSSAAAELGLTHGAISHRIRELEERTGTPLFRRAGRIMVPTREAITMLAQVRQILALLQNAFPDRRPRAGSRLVVSVHPSLATRWLIPRLHRFSDAHPDAHVEIRSTADLADFLDQGVDIAVRYGAGAWPGATDERLADEVVFAVCTPEYRDLHRIVRPADLSRCVLLRHSWQPWTPWLRAAGLKLAEPVNGLSVSDSAMLLEAAANGQGVALARSRFALDDLARGRLVRLFDVQLEDAYGYYVAWRAGTTLSGIAETFRHWLKRELTDQSRSDEGLGVYQSGLLSSD